MVEKRRDRRNKEVENVGEKEKVGERKEGGEGGGETERRRKGRHHVHGRLCSETLQWQRYNYSNGTEIRDQPISSINGHYLVIYTFCTRVIILENISKESLWLV